MHALVVDNIIVRTGGLPTSARRLDTGEWILGLRTASISLQEATGWYAVTEVGRPADTETHTFDRTISLIDGVPTAVWVERLKTAEELAADAANANRLAITTNLTSDMAAMQTLIDSTNANINANPAPHLKAIARMLRRLGRKTLNDFTSSD